MTRRTLCALWLCVACSSSGRAADEAGLTTTTSAGARSATTHSSCAQDELVPCRCDEAREGVRLCHEPESSCRCTATTSTGELSTGTDTGDAPRACDYALGCYAPNTPYGEVGAASELAVGCDGAAYGLHTSLLVDEEPWALPLVAERTRLAVQVHDLDDDGALDVLWTGEQVNGLGVAYGPLTSLGERRDVLLFDATPVRARGFDIADADGDGVQDIAVGERSGLRFFAGQVEGWEARVVEFADLTGAAFGNMDGVAGMEMVVGGAPNRGGIAVYGLDENAFPMRLQVFGVPALGSQVGPSDYSQIQLVDLDGDADLDVVAFGRDGSFFDASTVALVLRNEGDGQRYVELGRFSGPPGGSADHPTQGAVGDVDCDGTPDFVIGGWVYRHTGSTWMFTSNVDLSPQSLLADMDGDGRLDVVTANGGAVSIYRNVARDEWALAEELGNGNALPGFEEFNATSSWSIDVADLDGDGQLEVIHAIGADRFLEGHQGESTGGPLPPMTSGSDSGTGGTAGDTTGGFEPPDSRVTLVRVFQRGA